MTHDLLQSDVDLAIRLKDDQRPDAEVIQVLVHRGIDSGKAAQLLDDLRSGRKVNAKAPVPSEFAPARRTRAERHLTEEPSPAPSPAPHHHSGHASRPRGRGRASSKRFRRVFLVRVGLAVVEEALCSTCATRRRSPFRRSRSGRRRTPLPLRRAKRGRPRQAGMFQPLPRARSSCGRMACTSEAAL